MKSLLKVAILFFISANVAFVAGNVHSSAKGKVESSKSAVGTKANDPGKGQFARNPSKSIKPVGNADKGKIDPSPAYSKPDNSAKK